MTKLWVKYQENNSVRYDGTTFQADVKDILQVNGKDVDANTCDFKIGATVTIKGGSKKRSRIWSAIVVAEPATLGDGSLPKLDPSPVHVRKPSKGKGKAKACFVKKKNGKL